MKNWQITGFYTILIIGFLLMSGCINKGSTTTVPVAVSTPTPQIVYITVLVTQNQRVAPITEEHIVTLHFLDPVNSIVGAEVSVAYNSTTSPTGILGAGTQYGTTDSGGDVVFTMSSNIKYDLVITYKGKQTYYTIYPSGSHYIMSVW